MKRFGLLLVLITAALLTGQDRSHAAITVVRGFCFEGPYNTLVSCNTSPAPTRSLILPNKVLTVGNPVAAPLDTTSYAVNIVSSVACFPLDEPIHVYTLGGGNGSAFLSPLTPSAPPSPSPHSVVIHVDPKTASASLTLEVRTKALGVGGLVVKAVWPDESLERLVRVIAPASPTVTPTLVPGQATNTPEPTNTPVPTVDPSASATATATSTPTGKAFFVRSCVSPNPSSPTDFPTLYVQTLPGAVCTASVVYSDGTRPQNFNGGPEMALEDGFAVFPYQQKTKAQTGIARSSCSLLGSTLSSRTDLLITQPATATPGRP